MATIIGTPGSDTLIGTVANDLIDALGGDDLLNGGSGNDTLLGGLGNDTLIGGAGGDVMNGGDGDDTFYVDSLSDSILDTSGTDSVNVSLAAGTYSLSTGLENLALLGSAAINGVGNAAANTLTGNDAANTLDGGQGADTMAGHNGNDVYIVDDIWDVVSETNAAATGGVDTIRSSVQYTLGANVENLILTGPGAIGGTGNSLANTLQGNDQANALWGMGGADTLRGGKGDDSYYVNLIVTGSGTTAVAKLEDAIIENAGEGLDRIVLITYGPLPLTTASTISLGANIEALEASYTGDDKLNLLGNASNNTLIGNGADNTIDGGIGADSMVGLNGNDTYVVDNVGDVVEEYGGGIDTVKVAINATGSYTLTQNVEAGRLINTTAFDLYGNILDNVLIGNAASNTLSGGGGQDVFDGGGGNDFIFGSAGNDILDGGTGNDVLSGGGGNDIYVVDSLGDSIIGETGGNDLVIARLASGTWTLGAGLEALSLDGSAAINGVGNADANILQGNNAANTLDGGLGADVMVGNNGNDTYLVDNTADSVSESIPGITGGVDTVISSVNFSLGDNLENLTLTGSSHIYGLGNALANTIQGNAGDNQFWGMAGVDTIKGGNGHDSYYVNVVTSGSGASLSAKIEDVLVEGVNEGIDQIILVAPSDLGLTTASTITLAANFETLAAYNTGSNKLNLTGNTLANVIYGNDAGNIIDGGQGADTLYGRGGNDTYILDNAGDSVSESLGEGTDTVRIAFGTANGSYTLGSNVENATLVNAVAFQVNGNTLDNVLIGNAAANALSGGDGNDTLDGGAGVDYLDGGLGNDTFVIDTIGDTIADLSGTDTVIAKLSTGSFNLVAGLENLILGGTSAINGFGNNGVNTLIGNDAANTLDGAAGADWLEGGKGNDTYVVDDQDDTVVESSGGSAGGIDTVRSVIDYTLGDNVENLILTGTANYGVGNALANTIQGNDTGNNLEGGAGADTLKGGKGGDTYRVNLIASAGIAKLEDTLIENPGEGDDSIQLYAGNLGLTSATTLTLGANLENLSVEYTGTNLLNLVGNAANNRLNGNDADNTLDGGLGADGMAGGAGNDTYILDNVGDQVLEKHAADGIDTLRIGIATPGTYSLGANIENAILTNSVVFHLYGNELDNTLIGNGVHNTLNGGAGNDHLIGNADMDLLYGDSGNDTLDGGAGADVLVGGAGDDTYVVDVLDDSIADISGTDTVIAKLAAGGFTLDAYMENLTLGGAAAINGTGNAGNNTLIGNDAANTLDGGAGDDSMSGGKGNDTYMVDSSLDAVAESTPGAAGGIDTVISAVSFSLGDNLENLTLSGIADTTAVGNSLANILQGNDGNNMLYGGLGADVMRGGKGDDTYHANLILSGGTLKLEDAVSENASEGYDRLVLFGGNFGLTSAASISLGANIEEINAFNTLNDLLNITGNAQNNVIVGNSGANTIDGGLGADTMDGGYGDDTYVLDNVGDSVSELPGAGTDTLRIGTAATAFYTLGANIENATLINTVAYHLIGNALANTLVGNAAVNTLAGGGGNDMLIGGAGDDLLWGDIGRDTLDGGLGNDVLVGGDDDDVFIVDSLGDSLFDSDGIDTVIANIASGTYLLADDFEHLILGGTAALNGTGNYSKNILIGNDAANTLDGGGEADRMIGGKGNDVYIVDNAYDLVDESVAGAAGGIDTIRSSVSYTLGANQENLILTGANSVLGFGNALANTIVGNDGDNALYGFDGADVLKGGKGNDTYTVNVIASAGIGKLEDSIVENTGEGLDVLILQTNGDLGLATASTITLAANFENLIGATTLNNKLNFTGNAQANYISGNYADNVIDGGAGGDTLFGSSGNDTYLIDSTLDNVVENASDGTDTVKVGIATAGLTYLLPFAVENATLTNAVAYNLTGNYLDNILTGNGAANTLNGGDGNDTLFGNAGNDLLIGGIGNDRLDGGLGSDSLIGGDGDDTYIIDVLTDQISDTSGLDTVVAKLASGTYTLGASLEALFLDGSAAINGVGNSANNLMLGNDAANTLDGGSGADSMAGGKGNDTYIVDDLNDLVLEDTAGAAGGIDTVKSSVSFTLGSNLENLVLTGNGNLTGIGNDEANTLSGNASNNLLYGDGGRDTLVGGAGDDNYFVDLVKTAGVAKLEDQVVELAGGGTGDSLHLLAADLGLTTATTLTLAANVEHFYIDGTGTNLLNMVGNTADNIMMGNLAANSMNGDAGNDILYGLSGDDSLFGMAGNDWLVGDDGNDRILGGDGNDMLVGSNGNDTLAGGNGNDGFLFTSLAGTDVVQDFGVGDDQLLFYSATFSTLALNGATLDPNMFVLGTAATTASQHVIFDGTSGTLYYDADGSGVQAQIAVAVLAGFAGSLSAADIGLN